MLGLMISVMINVLVLLTYTKVFDHRDITGIQNNHILIPGIFLI
jgi:hypothetical protein